MKLTIDSPMGPLTLSEEGGRITAVDWGAGGDTGAGAGVLAEAAGQLAAYFTGGLRRFSLPLAPSAAPAAATRSRSSSRATASSPATRSG